MYLEEMMNSNLFFVLLFLAFGILNVFVNHNMLGAILNFLNGLTAGTYLVAFVNDLKNKK